MSIPEKRIFHKKTKDQIRFLVKEPTFKVTTQHNLLAFVLSIILTFALKAILQPLFQ